MEYNGDGTFKSSTVYGLGIDEVLARGVSAGEWPLPDRNGNTAWVTGTVNPANNMAYREGIVSLRCFWHTDDLQRR